MTKAIKKLFFLFLSGLFCINIQAEECKIDEFKSLYIKLQNELNYEHKDSRYNKKTHKIELVKHNPNVAYGGKVFEKSLVREYENSLKKVGALFENFKQTSSDMDNSNPELINFFRNIESSSPQEIETSQFNTILEQIQKKSYDLYKTNAPSYVINNSDIYLLKKLLIHASDKICRVELSELKKTHSNKYIEKTKQLPINRLVNFLKKSDQDHKIVDGPRAISLAIEEQMDNLRYWMANQSVECQNKIRNNLGNFNNVQECNYKHFIDATLANSLTNIEAVLHFINANKSRTDVMAETDLDFSKFVEKGKVIRLHATPEKAERAEPKIIERAVRAVRAVPEKIARAVMAVPEKIVRAVRADPEKDEMCTKLKINSNDTNYSWKCSYTTTLYSELSKPSFDSMFEIPLNKSDLTEFMCPNYNKMNRENKQRFFVVYLAAIAKSESDFNPTDHYFEKNGTNSLGMLAIDRTAANKATRNFGTITDQDLKDPKTNLKIGTYILHNQLKNSKYKGRLLTSHQDSAYYWSVIHNDDKKKKVIKSLMSNKSSLPSSCQN